MSDASPRPLRHAWRSAALSAASELPSTARLVVCALAEWMGDRTAACWPSVASIAAATGLSERAVRGHLHRLVDAGWLVIQTGGGRKSSVYEARMRPERGAAHPGTSCTPDRNVVPPTPAGEPPRGAPDAPEPTMNQESSTYIHHQQPVVASGDVVARAIELIADHELMMAKARGVTPNDDNAYRAGIVKRVTTEDRVGTAWRASLQMATPEELRDWYLEPEPLKSLDDLVVGMNGATK